MKTFVENLLAKTQRNFAWNESTSYLINGKRWFKIMTYILLIEIKTLLNYSWINYTLLKRILFISTSSSFFSFCGPYFWTPLFPSLRRIRSMLQKKCPGINSSNKILLQSLVSSSFLIFLWNSSQLFLSSQFTSRYLLLMSQGICSFLLISWLCSSIPSTVHLFSLFIISTVHFSISNFIPIYYLKILTEDSNNLGGGFPNPFFSFSGQKFWHYPCTCLSLFVTLWIFSFLCNFLWHNHCS